MAGFAGAGDEVEQPAETAGADVVGADGAGAVGLTSHYVRVFVDDAGGVDLDGGCGVGYAFA